MLYHLERMILYTQRVISLVDSLTVGDHLRVLDKAMNNLENLCGGQFGLVVGESV